MIVRLVHLERLVTRAWALGFVGIAAGMIHATLADKPITLRPKEPEPTVIDVAPFVPTGGKAGATASASKPASVSPNQSVTDTPTSATLGLEITVNQALVLFNQGMSFVDARGRDEYERKHVRSAFWMPAELFSGGTMPDAMHYLVKHEPVVVYCGGGACDASHNVVVLLQQAGFTKCHVMTDGLPGWEKAGHPTSAGKPEYE